MSCVGVDKSALCDEMTVGIYVTSVFYLSLSTRSCIFDCNSKPTNRDRRVFINRIGVYVRLLRCAVSCSNAVITAFISQLVEWSHLLWAKERDWVMLVGTRIIRLHLFLKKNFFSLNWLTCCKRHQIADH